VRRLWWLRQSWGFVGTVFEDAPRGRVCVRVFIGMSVRALWVSPMYCVIRKQRYMEVTDTAPGQIRSHLSLHPAKSETWWPSTAVWFFYQPILENRRPTVRLTGPITLVIGTNRMNPNCKLKPSSTLLLAVNRSVRVVRAVSWLVRNSRHKIWEWHYAKIMQSEMNKKFGMTHAHIY
jgi:hypothetical protein